jgi:hypothetical protein
MHSDHCPVIARPLRATRVTCGPRASCIAQTLEAEEQAHWTDADIKHAQGSCMYEYEIMKLYCCFWYFRNVYIVMSSGLCAHPEPK